MRGARFSLRAKLALASLALLALPAAGLLYVNEMERFLLDGQERALLATARAVATALHERPELLVAPPADDALRREAELELQRLAGDARPVEIAREEPVRARPAREEVAAILAGVQRSSSRIWVVNRRYQVLALAGSLRREAEETSFWQGALAWLIRRPSEDFSAALPDEVLATSRDIAAALQGTPGTRTRRTPDGRAVVLSAAHPIWNRDEVAGAVVVEETTNPIVSLRSAALERLLALTLLAFAAAAALLLFVATRISLRIRRLRDEAESAIDARGHITRLASGSDAADEIGDLSRSFSAMLARLEQHHAYLESMAGRLSHELRTPIAVVRSSLENLKQAPAGAEAARYVERAEQGLARLNTILERMTEASRLEESLRSARGADALERYDLVPVVRGCVEGYRLAYPAARFTLALPDRPLVVSGSADLAAQLLDKLVENAVDFSREGEAVRLALEARPAEALLTVSNFGPPLPEEMRGRLFGSMVSVRSGGGGRAPHLGLGLYVARLVAEYHGGSIEAQNLPGGEGVAIVVRLPVAPP